MFTGLIEEIGTLREVRPFAGGRRFRIGAGRLLGDLAAGDSIACDGVCLTVEETGPETFVVAAVAESLRRTTAGRWQRGRRIHLERALRAGDRLGGHWVQGHVDGLGSVLRAGREGKDFALGVRLPRELCRYVVAKGSLAVDGVSLTVGELHGTTCRLFLIPETLARTHLGALRPGEPVNLEVDLLAKYVESLLPQRGGAGS
jgi:riboflavin synthase